MKRISTLTLIGLVSISALRIWGQSTVPIAPPVMAPPMMSPASNPLSGIPLPPLQITGETTTRFGPGTTNATGGRPRHMLDEALSSSVRRELQAAIDSTPN